MKKLIVVAAIIIFCSEYLTAQSNYKIPVGETGNKISIKVTNPTSSEIKDVRVELVSSPEWVKFKNTDSYLGNIPALSNSSATFEFDIENNVFGNEEGIITYSINTSTVQRWYKRFSIETILPDKFELFQNYPNPFNPGTTIKFSLPAESRVLIKVVNILGETVKVLKNEEMKAGIHQVEFNGSGIASGVYFYSIEAGSYKSVKKMLLMR